MDVQIIFLQDENKKQLAELHDMKREKQDNDEKIRDLEKENELINKDLEKEKEKAKDRIHELEKELEKERKEKEDAKDNLRAVVADLEKEKEHKKEEEAKLLEMMQEKARQDAKLVCVALKPWAEYSIILINAFICHTDRVEERKRPCPRKDKRT